ncbi:TniQ family protein [Pseudomonas sp. PDM15]|uniref:TnsD family Tn7-like transposition protein n=1 Tax=Pseudomonas sp. PDM15 TaxID=2769303 RepID=UPI00177CD80A|nr:TnsD family Tn7-like transposition protein [Pseudomonas sp. PDM15]MBD9428254.1 TniQ family protein [Pseudomonas sp. PDM15]
MSGFYPASEIQPPDITLKWLEDETFFSICSRQHAIWGNHEPSATFRLLSESPGRPATHDFAYNLNALRPSIRSVWGDPDSIIHEHTILPLFLPFQSQPHIQAVMQMLKGEGAGSIKYRLGLVTGRFGAEHPLKACSCCIDSDFCRHGVAYWHVAHQYPGVLICPVHKVWLQESVHNRPWSGRFQLALPGHASLTHQRAEDLEPIELEALNQLATAILDLASVGNSRSFEPLLVRSVYRNALSQVGYRNPTSSQVTSSLVQHTSPLQPFHPLTSLPTTEQKASTFIEQLIRSPRGHSHPLKHLVMITWLFGDVSAFIDAYDRLAQEPEHPDAPQLLYTDTQAAKPSEPIQAKKLKPKTLKPPMRAQILRMLSRGAQKHSICSQFSITISTVNKLLRAEPLAQKSWIAAKFQKDLLKHRSEWSSLLQQFPDSSASVVRAHGPNLYAWLYRNDKAWLVQEISRLPTGRNGNNSKVDWSERDIELERSVENAMKLVLSTHPDHTCNKQSIHSLVPALSSCLQNTNQYPRTRALLLRLKQQRF